jgi:hypothetical protein
MNHSVDRFREFGKLDWLRAIPSDFFSEGNRPFRLANTKQLVSCGN